MKFNFIDRNLIGIFFTVILIDLEFVSSISVENERIATMYFEFSNYRNPLNQLSNNNNCDGRSPCDPIFYICVSPIPFTVECSLINFTTTRVKDVTAIAGVIYSTEVPLQSPLASSYNVSIRILDIDAKKPNDPDYIGTFIFNDSIKPFSNQSLPWKRTERPMRRTEAKYMNKNLTVTVELDISCSINRFGDFCEVECLPQVNYSCGADGKKICKQGLAGNDCNKLDPCISNTLCADEAKCVAQNDGNDIECECKDGSRVLSCYRNVGYNPCLSSPCSNDGECLARNNGYYCNCTEFFRGPRCELKKSACEFQPCLNGGVCYDNITDNGTNTFECNCPELFTGKICAILITTIEPTTMEMTTPLDDTSIIKIFTPTFLIVMTISSITLVFIAILLLLWCYLYRRKKYSKNRRMEGPPDPMSIPLSTMNDDIYLTPILTSTLPYNQCNMYETNTDFFRQFISNPQEIYETPDWPSETVYGHYVLATCCTPPPELPPRKDSIFVEDQ